MIHATFFAPLMLGICPLVIIALFMMYPAKPAIMMSLIWAELVLPPIYTLPISPSWLSKWTLPPFIIGICAVIYSPKSFRRVRPFQGIEGLFLINLLVNIMAFVTNRDAIQYGPVILPGENAKDLIADVVRFFGDPWILFFVGRAVFKTSKDLKILCRMLVLSVLIYSVPMLFEIRMSPNLNYWIYGFQATRFDMTLRWGGYRPTVFFKDGLPLATYVLTCAIISAAMARTRMRVKQLPMKWVGLYTLFLLVICKSTGSIAYGLLVIPMIHFLPERATRVFASVLAFGFLLYPILRFTGVIPIKPIVEFFAGMSSERAQSLFYRFNMEDMLMLHTLKRPWWGWGDWGRNLVFDARTGQQLSIPDGQVIITLASHGIIGLFSYFVPFAWTILRSSGKIKKVKSRQDRVLLGGLAVACAVILFDLIVNSAFVPLYMLMFGALYSLPSGIAAEERVAQQAAEAEAFDSGYPQQVTAQPY